MKSPIALIVVLLMLFSACDKSPVDRTSDRGKVLMPFKEGDLWGYGNEQGQIVVQPQFDEALVGFDGVAPVRSRNRWGFVVDYGARIVTPRFDAARLFQEGRATVRIGEKWGYVDGRGEIVIAPRFDRAFAFFNGLAAIRLGTKMGWIDRAGTLVIPAKYDWAGNFSDGLAPFAVGSRIGFIDIGGTVVIEPKYDSTHQFSEGLAPVQNGFELYYIDRNDKRALDPRVDVSEASAFFDGRAKVKLRQQHYGYIDRNGDLVIEARYSQAWDFSEGLAPVCVDGGVEIDGLNWDEGVIQTHFDCFAAGYIDTSGKLVIEPTFQVANPFMNGVAYVEAGDRAGYIDKTGRWILPRAE